VFPHGPGKEILQLRYANADHPHPLHLTRTNGSAATACPLAGRPGPALGLFDGAKYETLSCKLSPRDVVLLFTEVCLKSRAPMVNSTNYEQLSKAVGNRTELPAAELCRSLIDEVQHFSATPRVQ
jgi:phosphoserine phosphatase RsbU/P